MDKKILTGGHGGMFCVVTFEQYHPHGILQDTLCDLEQDQKTITFLVLHQEMAYLIG